MSNRGQGGVVVSNKLLEALAGGEKVQVQEELGPHDINSNHGRSV